MASHPPSAAGATLLPTAPNSPGGLPSYMFEFEGMDSTLLFDPQFELPESWGEEGGGRQGEPGGYDDFNPLPPLSFPPLPFTLETDASSSNQFYPPTTLQPLPPAPPPDQLNTSLFSTFESSALSSFLTATLEGEPSPPPFLPPHHRPPPSSSNSHSFKKSSESAFAGLVKARGAWDFNPVLPKGLPSWKKVGEGVQGVPSLSGLERMRIEDPSSSSRGGGGRNPGDIGGQSGALVDWPSFAPSEYGPSSSSYRGGGGHTSINSSSTPLPNGRPSASISSSSKRPPSTSRRRPSSSSSSRPQQQQQQQQPAPPSSNTSRSTPSASTPTTLPDTDALMSEPTISRGAPTDEGIVVDDSDEIMRVVRVAGVDEDEGEEELDVDDDGEESGTGAVCSSKGKGKRTAGSAPTPTPPPSQRDDDFIPPSSSRTKAASRNRKRPKHDSLAPPPPTTTSTSTRRTSFTSSSSASSSNNNNNKLQTPSSPEDTPMQAVDHLLPSQPSSRTNRAPSVTSSAGGGASSSTNGVGAVEVKQEGKEQQQKGSFGRGLLTAKEKRENHILSEQKRRNAIRSSYAELSLILTSSTLSPLPLTLPPSPPPSSSNSASKKRGAKGSKVAASAAGGDVGVGRGGSKSSVLGKAVGLVRWLGEGNEWLEREVERLGGLVGGEDGGVKMEG